MTIAAGTHPGPYEILEILAPIGGGGMGDVYKARGHATERIVAITEFG